MIEVLPLGAGQDVGRSCVIVSVGGGKRIMFDCGMHMRYHDERRFPDFSLVHADTLTAVVISHFHLDHCGALPFLTGIVGYRGPIIMTAPTRTICPLLLEDYRKIVVERRGEAVTPGAFFTSAMIDACMQQVVTVGVGESVDVEGVKFTPFYAGHVLGAAMFLMSHGPFSCLYTGDFNMTPDRHLGAARLPDKLPLNLQLDFLITETTYATTVRESKRSRERDFLRSVHQCVLKGGKVLIPTFALGRAQELCLLIDTYWTRMGLDPNEYPIYFSAGLAEKANDYYGLHLDWTSESVKRAETNSFAFKNIRVFEKQFAELPGPMVLFSTPGMLHSGQSLHVFTKWAGDERNLLIIPGYCVAGTVGAKVLAGHKMIDVDLSGGTQHPVSVDVKIKVKNLSFSAHADSKGIMQLIKQLKPRNVMLVHGEKAKMGALKESIEKAFAINCLYPANGQYVYIAPNHNCAPGVFRGVDEALNARRLKIHQAAVNVYQSDLLSVEDKIEFLKKSSKAQSSEELKMMVKGKLNPTTGMIEFDRVDLHDFYSTDMFEFTIDHRKASVDLVYKNLLDLFHPMHVVTLRVEDSLLSIDDVSIEFLDNNLTVKYTEKDTHLVDEISKKLQYPRAKMLK